MDFRINQEPVPESLQEMKDQAGAAVEKAELDLARTKVLAPARGIVTDLRTDVGHYAQPGAPVMTLIAMHDLWISAELTENNLGNIDAGDEVAHVGGVAALAGKERGRRLGIGDEAHARHPGDLAREFGEMRSGNPPVGGSGGYSVGGAQRLLNASVLAMPPDGRTFKR